jgi:hypothetical protein
MNDMIDKRCFLQWFVLTLGYVVTAFFGWRYGLLQSIYAGDITHMTSVIAAVFVISCLYLGFGSWRFGCKALVPFANDAWIMEHRIAAAKVQLLRDANADVGIGRAAGFMVTLIGLLGTAIGLMVQVKAMGAVNVGDPASIVGFISTIGAALATALYATACGIVACLGITLLNANLEYFVDRQEGGSA